MSQIFPHQHRNDIAMSSPDRASKRRHTEVDLGSERSLPLTQETYKHIF